MFSIALSTIASLFKALRISNSKTSLDDKQSHFARFVSFFCEIVVLKPNAKHFLGILTIFIDLIVPELDNPKFVVIMNDHTDDSDGR
jgi:hypothetical protein